MIVKMLVMDVDGTMTDGCIYMGAEGELMKAFNAQDGYGIVHILPELGIVPVIITGRKSQIVERRADELKIQHLYQGVDNKLALLRKLAAELNVSLGEVAYIGDDLNDWVVCGIAELRHVLRMQFRRLWMLWIMSASVMVETVR